MALLFFLGLTSAGVAITARCWLKAWVTAGVIARLAPALGEIDEFFALVDLSGQDAHFLERHGPMLKRTEVLQRAETEQLEVSGLSGRPVASARWYRHAYLLQAVTSALDHWYAGARPQGGRFTSSFNEAIGEGYAKVAANSA